MFKQKRILFVLALLYLTSSDFFSQTITATPSIGCVNSTFLFTGPAGANINWSFGDGSFSGQQNPGKIYTSTGTFVVTYTSSTGNYSLNIIVTPLPTAGFTYTVPLNKCAPVTVTFASTSSSGTTIAQYQWNFNGVPSSSQNPVITFNSGGTYNPTLTVIDAFNCSGTVTAGPILISNTPTINITTNPSPPIGCSTPFTAAFSASNSISGSPTGGSLTYSWSFSGGLPSGSNVQTPGNIIYNSNGSYNALLTVTDNNTCSKTATIPVQVVTPTLSVTNPSVVCPGKTFSVNVQSNVNTVANFGIGGIFPSVLTNVTHTCSFPSPGTYTINVTAGNVPCTNVTTKTIVVESVSTAITSTPGIFSCSNPLVAQYFNSSSPNVVSYTWTSSNCSGPNLISNAANPTFSFVQGSLNPYTIFQACNPTVSLTVSSVNGCTASASIQTHTLQRPTAWFLKNKKEGCAPLVVTYRDSSFAYPTPTVITSYTWNNGANPPTIVTGTAPPIPNITFTYNTPGTYTPFLTIQTAQGCTDVSFIDTVTVVNPAPLSFTFSPQVVCPNTIVNFSNTSANQNQIQHWHVTSDAGFFSGCVSAASPTWNFTHIGAHNFTLSAWKNSCMSSTTIPQTIQVNGPIVQSRFTTNCSNRKSVLFTTHLQDAANATLDFGDGTPLINFTGSLAATATHTINHTYASTGDYTATIIASNGSGTCSPYTYTMLVTVRDVQAAILSPSFNCVGNTNIFSATSSTDILVTCSTGYTWFFDNIPPVVTTSNQVSHAFLSPGEHTVVLQVKDINSCMDTAVKKITISSAAPQFSINTNQICLSSGTIQLVNTTPQVPDAITNYTWTFGDGGVISGPNTPSIANPTYTYLTANSPGSTYTITLTALNSAGCDGVQTATINVLNPSAAINALPSNSICPGQSVSIIAPSGYASYSLNFGDGSASAIGSNSVTHTYSAMAAGGSYQAVMSITNNIGCKSTATLAIYTQSVVADFTVSSPSALLPNTACLGDNILFTSTSQSNPSGTLSFQWNGGTAATLMPVSPVIVTYVNTGNYPVTLTVTSSFGCKSVITKSITVSDVKARINLDKTNICLGQTVNFNLKDSSKVYEWNWDFGEGTTDSVYASPSPSPSVSLTYTYYPPNGSALVVLVSHSSQFACKHIDTVRITINKTPADFNRNNEALPKDSLHCLGEKDLFTCTTNSVNTQYNWNFGDGGTSSLMNPEHTYSVAGIYSVVLTVTNTSNGCLGFSIKNMTIHPVPLVSILAEDACQNEVFPLIGNISPPPMTFTWSPSLGIADTNALSTTASASVSTSYSLSATNIYGCEGSTVHNVYIQQPPVSINWDTTIVIGQVVPVPGNAGQNFTYSWTPPYYINCQNCSNPISTTTDNITYTVVVADNMGCYSISNTFRIKVEPKSTVDVPTAFTPNGDGTNDVIYVDGWGIRKLNYFRIYNRWGQLLFESNDIKIGWDGNFEGVPQNMETYIYQVSVETFVDKEAMLLTGSFKLIR